jgi:hypothetical protein
MYISGSDQLVIDLAYVWFAGFTLCGMMLGYGMCIIRQAWKA